MNSTLYTAYPELVSLNDKSLIQNLNSFTPRRQRRRMTPSLSFSPTCRTRCAPLLMVSSASINFCWRRSWTLNSESWLT